MGLITGKQLRDDLARMGLTPSDSVMLHSSMRAIGQVEGGADTVIDAFTGFLSEGLFMVPTHTWAQMGPDHDIFDPDVEPSCVGIISNLTMRRPEAFRSLHPTHSIAAIGKGAREYVSGEETRTTPCPEAGCFGRLRDIGARILLAGVTHVKNTYIHSIEESFDIPERLTQSPVPFKIKMPDGSLLPVMMHRHYNAVMAHISESFDKLRDYWFDTGAAVRVRLGNADCILCDAARLFETTGEILRQQPDYFIPRTEKGNI